MSFGTGPLREAIEGIFKSILSQIGSITTESDLLSPLDSLFPNLYGFIVKVVKDVSTPMAYVIFTLFMLIELHSIVIRSDVMGSSGIGVDMIFKVLFKFLIYKKLIDSVDLILRCMFQLTISLSTQIGKTFNSYMADTVTEVGKASADFVLPPQLLAELKFWPCIGVLILSVIAWVATLVAGKIATILINIRFVELYILFAVAPLPMSTMPSQEYSQIAKGFLKNFAAVCLKGTVMFMVATIFPVILKTKVLNSVSSDGIWGNLIGVIMYSCMFCVVIWTSDKWARSIVGS
jgi:hypothetical protein